MFVFVCVFVLGTTASRARLSFASRPELMQWRAVGFRGKPRRLREAARWAPGLGGDFFRSGLELGAVKLLGTRPVQMRFKGGSKKVQCGFNIGSRQI